MNRTPFLASWKYGKLLVTHETRLKSCLDDCPLRVNIRNSRKCHEVVPSKLQKKKIITWNKITSKLNHSVDREI